jgi:hypothetical protein
MAQPRKVALWLAALTGGGIAATTSLTESADTASSTSVIALSATLSKTESSDTTSTAATLALSATTALTESADTLSSDAISAVDRVAGLAVSETADTLSSASLIDLIANAILEEDYETVSSSTLFVISASLIQTEGQDTLSGLMTRDKTATLNKTESSDTLSSFHSASVFFKSAYQRNRDGLFYSAGKAFVNPFKRIHQSDKTLSWSSDSRLLVNSTEVSSETFTNSGALRINFTDPVTLINDDKSISCVIVTTADPLGTLFDDTTRFMRIILGAQHELNAPFHPNGAVYVTDIGE